MPSILIKSAKPSIDPMRSNGDDDLVRSIKRLIVIFRKSPTRDLFGGLEVIWIYKKKNETKKGV